MGGVTLFDILENLFDLWLPICFRVSVAVSYVTQPLEQSTAHIRENERKKANGTSELPIIII